MIRRFQMAGNKRKSR